MTDRNAHPMTPIPRTAEDPRLLDLATRLIWWKSPGEALIDERRFVAQAMALGGWDDMQLVRSTYGDDALRAVLADPPAGVFDRRSWNYWHLVIGNGAAPPLPRRRL